MASIQETPIPNEEKAGELMHHMFVIKDIRAQTLQLEKMKFKLVEHVQGLKAEEDRIHDYKNELELLEQERLAHVEELRQIHADMRAMETVIREADDDRNRSLDLAWKVFQEYSELKDDIDERRLQLGLGGIPPIYDGENVLDKQYFQKIRSLMDKQVKFQSSVDLVEHATNNSPHASRELDAVGTTVHNLPSTSTKIDSSRAQDPPMKICESCQQSIHRNAPVCPLCKAKNRSRHPKKIKRKHENDDSS